MTPPQRRRRARAVKARTAFRVTMMVSTNPGSHREATLTSRRTFEGAVSHAVALVGRFAASLEHGSIITLSVQVLHPDD